MSAAKQKGVRLQSDRERDILDLFHPAPASTRFCLLSDFHLKPTPVMGNKTRLHLARQDEVSEVSEHSYSTFDRLLLILLSSLRCHHH